jgi:hypothetical protein
VNEIDRARIGVREAIAHLLKVCKDAMPDDPTCEKDKEDVQDRAEYMFEKIVYAEIEMVENGIT